MRMYQSIVQEEASGMCTLILFGKFRPFRAILNDEFKTRLLSFEAELCVLSLSFLLLSISNLLNSFFSLESSVAWTKASDLESLTTVLSHYSLSEENVKKYTTEGKDI